MSAPTATEATEAADPRGTTTIAAGRGYTVAAFIHAAYALALLPPLFGLIGVILGVIGWRKGDPKGRLAAWCSVGAAVAGLAISAILFQGA